VKLVKYWSKLGKPAVLKVTQVGPDLHLSREKNQSDHPPLCSPAGNTKTGFVISHSKLQRNHRKK